ncbi:MAG: Plug and carboxypeptidase regulatory-like domain-containing protein [Acidobacteriota bacterium]|nr:Plug and carboxypeptidase regulatory-like domain-containing protein [Acidobacteriota bacterium]
MHRFNRVVYLLLCCAFAFVLRAQITTGTISGTVVDQGGAAVPDAAITVTDQSTKATRSAVTSDSGLFTITSLQAGSYTTRVTKTGFEAFERVGDSLVANQQLSLGTISLTVGAVNQTIEVQAQAAQVETTTYENSATLTGNEMSMIAERGRDVVDMLRLLPGVSQTTQTEALGGAGGPPGVTAPNISGARNGAIDFTVDGVAGNDNGTASSLSSAINMDAIAEVNVLLANYTAQYGRNGGAILSIITKGGSSEFHGTAYWYVRNQIFNANDFLLNRAGFAKPAYKFNTLGATIGGPVLLPHMPSLKNKLFFFYSYDYTHAKFPAPFVYYTMPTALERQGNFSQSATKPIDPTTGAAFPGAIIPSNRLNPSTQALINVFPLPNQLNRAVTNGAYNYAFQGDYDIPKLSNVFRIDSPISTKDSIFVRGVSYHSDTQAWNTGAVGAPSWPWFYGHYQFTDDSISAHETHIFSPNIVNEILGAVRHSTENAPPVSFAQFNSVGTRSGIGFTAGQVYPGNNPYNVIPQITSLSGVSDAPNLTYDSRFPETGADTTFDVSDTLSIIRGSHTFKLGTYWHRAREFEGPRGNFGGGFDFSANATNPENSGNPFANLVLGNFNTYSESNDHVAIEQRLYDWDNFVQDTWKITKKLTLDVGVRITDYTPWKPSTDHGWDAATLVLSQYNAADAARLYRPAIINGVRVGYDAPTGQAVSEKAIGNFVPGTGSVSPGAVLASSKTGPRGWINQSPPRLAPRVGFAYDPFGDGKTSIRGGFGMFYETQTDGNIGFSFGAPPAQLTSAVYNGNVGTYLNAGSFVTPGNTFILDPQTITPYNMNASFGIQRDIGLGTVIEARWVGTYGRHLWTEENLNLLPFGAQFLPQSIDPTVPGGKTPYVTNLLVPIQGYGSSANYLTPSSSSNYNGLQVTANHRLTHGLSFGVAYTYSKVMDFNDTDLTIGTPTYFSARRNYSLAGFDQTHVLSIHYTYDIPIARSWQSVRAAKLVASNWQISGVATFASGFPVPINFSTTNGENTSGGGDPQRVNLTCNPNLPHSDRSITRFFDTSCVQFMGVGQVGDAARNPIRGPGINNFDLTVFRNFNLGSEKRVLTFRWEFYNIFNHSQFRSVDANALFTPAGVQSNSDFGVVNGTRPPRVMQGSLRFRF